MLILVINCGSSSLKFKLIDTCSEQIENNEDKVLASGHIENIGEPEAKIHYDGDSTPIDKQKKVNDHKQALNKAIELMEKDGEYLNSHEDLDAIGHRVVHGGELLSRSVLIDKEVKNQIEECIQFAPLHNPHNLAGIEAVEEEFPEKPQVAAFDTGIHQ
ncbi:MAG: acetate kinase, partial [bacterium]